MASAQQQLPQSLPQPSLGGAQPPTPGATPASTFSARYRNRAPARIAIPEPPAEGATMLLPAADGCPKVVGDDVRVSSA